MNPSLSELPVDQILLVRGSGADWRQCLREWCEHYFQISPGELAYAERGKPYFLDQPDLHFSVSHTRDSVCIAFARQAVGLDIEYLDRRPRALLLAERYFQPIEADFIRAQPESCQASTFLKLWTAKEACVKLTGEGIYGGLAKCHLESGESPIRARQNGRTVHLRQWRGADGLLATVAAWDEFQLVSVAHS